MVQVAVESFLPAYLVTLGSQPSPLLSITLTVPPFGST